MLKIFICDDNHENLNTLQSYIQRLSQECGVATNISAFDNGYDLLDAYTNDVDICFLDIQMNGITGIDVARKIREVDERVTLVFMTNYAQYALEGFSVHAYQYLLKPIDYFSFSKELKSIFITNNKNNEYVLDVKNDNGIYRIAMMDIQYIETTSQKNCLIHTSDKKTYTVYSSLKSLLPELKPENVFFRCHNSYVVNFQYVSSIQKDEIILKNGEMIPVSRHRKKELLQAYMDYVGGLI